MTGRRGSGRSASRAPGGGVPARALAGVGTLLFLLVSGGEPLLAQAGGVPEAEPLRGELRIHADESMDVSIIANERASVPAGLLERVLAGEGEEVVESNGEVRLVWVGRSRPVAVELLREARGASETFRLRMFMPVGAIFEDLWSFQAELSQAGIRRVQIVSGLP